MCKDLGIGFIFKTSFDKANRTSITTKRGVGMTAALDVFNEIRQSGIPVITDVHERLQCGIVSLHVDALQIPALLSRQTDLIQAAAATGLPVNIKKGQFMSPYDVSWAAAKAGDKVMVTERGTTFGYNTVVVDMRSLEIMKPLPIIFDASHTTQAPGAAGSSSGGNRYMTPPLARAAVAVGIAAVFIECHDDPDNAPSDGPCMTHLRDMKPLIEKLMQIDGVVK